MFRYRTRAFGVEDQRNKSESLLTHTGLTRLGLSNIDHRTTHTTRHVTARGTSTGVPNQPPNRATAPGHAPPGPDRAGRGARAVDFVYTRSVDDRSHNDPSCVKTQITIKTHVKTITQKLRTVLLHASHPHAHTIIRPCTREHSCRASPVSLHLSIGIEWDLFTKEQAQIPCADEPARHAERSKEHTGSLCDRMAIWAYGWALSCQLSHSHLTSDHLRVGIHISRRRQQPS